MRNLVSTYVDQFRQDRQKQIKLAVVLAALAVIVAGVVFWQLHSTGVAMTNEVFCGMEEHVHDDSCYEQVLVCGLDESEPVEGHVHTDACYETVETLVCQDESEGHVHTEECYVTEQNLVCGLEESQGTEGHIHSDACYEMVLTCEIPEHTHTIECLIDENADVETADDWEATLPDELSSVWAEDVVAVAESQIGYTESETNFQLADDGETRQGYTRYGAWYGNEYGDWEAMFVSFCLNYAGVPEEEFPEASGVYAWTAELDRSGLFVSESGFTPKAGDVVFFDSDADGRADGVGIIENIDDSQDTLSVIEGNSSDRVEVITYQVSDDQILGYGVLPDQEDTVDSLLAHAITSAIADDGYVVTDLKLREEYKAEGGQEYDAYSFTPDADGIYYGDVSGSDVSTVYLFYYDDWYGGYPEFDGYSYVAGGDYGTPFVYLHADEQYYIVVENAGSYAGYDINIDGIASGEQSITTDTEYDLGSSDVRKDAWEEAFFTFVPEVTGDYSFTTSSGNGLSVMWENLNNNEPDQYNYESTSNNTTYVKLTLSAGTTYYLCVWPNSGDLSGTLTVTLDYEYKMVDLEFNETYEMSDSEPMYSDSNVDLYVVTPEVDGMYWIETEGTEGDVSLTIYYPYNSNRDPVGWQGRSIDSTEYIGLNAGVTYYIEVQRYSNNGQTYDPDSFEGYTILWTGVRAGDNSITLDAETPVTGTKTFDWDDTEYKWEMYSFTAEVSGLYTFSSDAGANAYLTDAYQVNHYDIRPTYYLSGGAEGAITIYMEAGETYFLDVYALGDGDVNVLLTMAGTDMIQFFTHTGDKTSAGSGDTISYTMDTQVIVPQYTQLSAPMDMVDAREWFPEDFTITFHDSLDKGLAFDPDSVVVTMSYDDGYDQATYSLTDLNGSGNADGNTLYTVTTGCSDGCDFEVTIDLTELYWTQGYDGYYLFGDFEWTLPYTTFEVTYDAVLNSDAEHNGGTAMPGEYDSTAYVSAFCTDNYYDPEYWGSTAEFTDESDPETVAVDTYGLVFFKYDSDTWVQYFSGKPDWIPDEVVPLEGAEFKLYNGFGGSVIDTLVTDADGCAYSHITFADGAYIYFSETQAPEGYEPIEGTWQFTLNGKYAEDDYWYWYDYGNEKIPADGDFNVSKVDDKGDPLEGAEFVMGYFWETPVANINTTPDGNYQYYYGIFTSDSTGAYVLDLDNSSDTRDGATALTTDEDGFIHLEGLPSSYKYDVGYFLIETKAPDGYELLEVPIVFTVDNDGRIEIVIDNDSAEMNDDGTVMTVTDEQTGYPVDVYKYDSVTKEPLETAEFVLARDTGDGSYEYAMFNYDRITGIYEVDYWRSDTYWHTNCYIDSDSEGYIHMDGLVPGEYVLIEVYPSSWTYLLPEDCEFAFTVNEDGTVTSEYWDDEYKAISISNDEQRLQVLKTDDNGYPLDGAEFVLGSIFQQHQEQSLLSVPVDGTSWYYQYLIFDTDSTTGEYVLRDNLYSDTREGATKLVTGSDGMIHVRGLYTTGLYFLVETTAPEGYELLENPIVFYVDYDGSITIYISDEDRVSASDTTITVMDDASVFDVQIYKYVEYGNDESVEEFLSDTKTYAGSDSPLSGAEFTLSKSGENDTTLYAVAEETVNPYGFIYYTITEWTDDETKATTFVSDEVGYIDIVNVEAGVYTLTETKAPDGYVLLTEAIVFEVDSGGHVTVQSGPAAINTDNEGNEIIAVANEEVTGGFELKKTDGNNPLSGAEFVLGWFGKIEHHIISDTQTLSTTEDGNYYYYYAILDYDETSGTYVFNWEYALDDLGEATKLTTDNNGSISIENLPVTSLYDTGFFLIETKAPDGYNLLEDPIVFTVSDDGTIQIAVNNTSASMNNDGTVMTVVNDAGRELPYTGGIGTWIYTVAGVILIGGAATLLVYRKRRAV